MTTSELVSAVAAVASALAGALAVIAAFRSAESARKAHLAADEAERRTVLRQVVSTARDVELEAKRCGEAVVRTGRSHKDLATFTGNFGGSPHQLMRDALAKKSERAEAIEREGRLFGTWPSTLESAPLSESDRILTKLLALVSEARAMQEDLERDRSDVERQCDVYRRKAIEGRVGQ